MAKVRVTLELDVADDSSEQNVQDCIYYMLADAVGEFIDRRVGSEGRLALQTGDPLRLENAAKGYVESRYPDDCGERFKERKTAGTIERARLAYALRMAITGMECTINDTGGE